MTHQRSDLIPFDSLMKRLLTVGHSQEGYGFGRVLSSLFEIISEHYEVAHLELSSADVNPGWANATFRSEPHDRLGIESLEEAVLEHRAELVFIYGEFSSISAYNKTLKGIDVAAIGYCTVDGEISPMDDPAFMDNFSLILFPNESCWETVSAAWKYSDMPGTRIGILPHGVDLNKFYAIKDSLPDSRMLARKIVFPHLKIPDQAFMVLNANRNTYRKRLDLTIKGFADFARDKPDVYLCLHAGMKDGGDDLVGHIYDNDIANKVLLTSDAVDHGPEVSDEQLNLVYNCCQVGINNSGGESWGLVNMEHAATSAAQIISKNKSSRNLWKDAAVYLDTVQTPEEPYFSVKFSFPDASEITRQLNLLYRDRPLLDLYSSRAKNTASAYSWQAAAATLIKYIQEIN